MQVSTDSKAGKIRLKSRQEKTPRQARKTQRPARKDSMAGKKRLQGRQEKTTKQARKDYKAG